MWNSVLLEIAWNWLPGLKFGWQIQKTKGLVVQNAYEPRMVLPRPVQLNTQNVFIQNKHKWLINNL